MFQNNNRKKYRWLPVNKHGKNTAHLRQKYQRWLVKTKYRPGTVNLPTISGTFTGMKYAITTVYKVPSRYFERADLQCGATVASTAWEGRMVVQGQVLFGRGVWYYKGKYFLGGEYSMALQGQVQLGRGVCYT